MLDKFNSKSKECSDLNLKLKELEPKLQMVQKYGEIKDKLEKEISDLKNENSQLKSEAETYRTASTKSFSDLFSIKEQLGEQSNYVKKLEEECKAIPELHKQVTMVGFL